MKTTKKSKGFLTQCLENVKELFPTITDEQIAKISKEIRLKFGGSSYRIPKNPGDKNKKAAKGLTIKKIEEKLKVSRSYAYKLYREVNKTAKK
ncbi:MAG: hypothetical protein A3K04_11155 [Gallionellales bacterium RBG_16_56_9]|nr:MAG: hypothetical protein A3K04_11155 [Gallionellales bacterium RBG_16_56_9]